jgi:hypothetical protein
VVVVYDPILGASVYVVTLPPVAMLPVEVRGREGLGLVLGPAFGPALVRVITTRTSKDRYDCGRMTDDVAGALTR